MPSMEHPYQAVVGELLAGLDVVLDHISICVRDLDAAGRAWAALLGCEQVDRQDVVAQKTRVVFLRPAAGPHTSAIELISPMAGNAGLEKFLEQRGDAIHHIAFAVSDLHAALARLQAANIRLIDQAPRPGACGHTVAFLHPKVMNGTLIELVQHGPTHTPR